MVLKWSQMYLYVLRYHLLPQESPHAMYGVYNIETMHRLNKDLELHFLEVPKFQKKPVKEMTKIERWIAYFSIKLNAEEMEELAMSEAAIQNAMDAACVFMQNQEERLAYINRQIAILDYESDKRAWIEEAEKRGEERGEKRGERRGRDAERESFLYKMIRQGYDDEAIHALTLFSMDDIRSARMNFHKK